MPTEAIIVDDAALLSFAEASELPFEAAALFPMPFEFLPLPVETTAPDCATVPGIA